MKTSAKNVSQLLVAAALLLLTSACTPKPLYRESPQGPTFQAPQLGVYLNTPLNTGIEDGPISFKVSSPVRLSDNTELPADSLLAGYYATRGNRVLFAPSFAVVKTEKGEQRLPINSFQTGRISLTPSSARYLKEAGKGAAVGAGVGAIGGGIAGGLQHGVVGAVVGTLAGAAIGAGVGAGSSSLGLWLDGDKPVQLPVGSGLMIEMIPNE